MSGNHTHKRRALRLHKPICFHWRDESTWKIHRIWFRSTSNAILYCT